MLRFLRNRVKEHNVAGTLVVGCGGAGCNVADRLGKISGIDILTMNTDRKGLVRSRSNTRMLLGGVSEDEGCGGDVDIGEASARGSSDLIEEHIKGYRNVVIVAGLGGGTGTGSLKVVSEMAERNGSRVVVIVTLPMSFETERRMMAIGALPEIKEHSDILLILDGDRLAEIDPMLSVREAFSILDQMICESFFGMMEMLEGKDGDSLYQMMKGKTLTVSFAEGINAESVAGDLITGLMLDAAVTSDPVIFIRGNVSRESEKKISDMISEKIGMMPLFIRGPEGQGMNLIMFSPVQ